MQTRLVIGAGLLLAAFAMIAVATYFGNNEAYYTVDELVSDPGLYGRPAAGMVRAAEAAMAVDARPLDAVMGAADDVDDDGHAAAAYGAAAAEPASVSLAGSAASAGRRMQVRGDIDKGTVTRGEDGLELRFTLTGKDHMLPVVYRDMVPDTFDLAKEVTVGGRVGPDGTFEADQLFVQCPSKYEAEPPGANQADSATNG